MRRYKLAIHILVILSVFNSVLVLAAPVLVQEVREAGTDVAGGGEDVVIMLGKRGGSGEGQDPLTQASPAPGSSSTSDYPSGVHQETTNPIQLPSSEPASGVTRFMRVPSYGSIGVELPPN